MKLCGKCGTAKILRGKRWLCRDCQIKAQSEHYKRNVINERLKRKDYNTKRKSEQYQIIAKLKEKPCTDCKQSFPHYIMEFDHLEDKVQSISHMVGYSLDKIMKEIQKCELVCANCHRRRTWNRQHNASLM